MPHGGEAWGGMGPARRSGGVADSDARTSDMQPAPKQGRAGANRWASAIVPGGGGLNIFQIQMNSNYFKTFQTLTNPKTAFPSPLQSQAAAILKLPKR
jgi:hypothetical protein